MNIFDRLYEAFMSQGRYMLYFDGLLLTLKITVLAVIIGMAIGVLVAIVKVSRKQNTLMGFLARLGDLYTTVIRGTPVLLQLLIIYNLIFTSRSTSEVLVGAVCFGINSGAYIAEIVRAGIEAVDNGQTEAGRSLGFKQGETMRYIILPQAIKNILPALGNEFIVLIKETSVGSVIAITELTKAATLVGSRTYDILPPLFIAAAFYLVLVLILQKFQGKLERRMAQVD